MKDPCKQEIGCHSCEENVKNLVEEIDQFLATKSFKSLYQLANEMESLRNWLLVQWSIKKES